MALEFFSPSPAAFFSVAEVVVLIVVLLISGPDIQPVAVAASTVQDAQPTNLSDGQGHGQPQSEPAVIYINHCASLGAEDFGVTVPDIEFSVDNVTFRLRVMKGQLECGYGAGRPRLKTYVAKQESKIYDHYDYDYEYYDAEDENESADGGTKRDEENGDFEDEPVGGVGPGLRSSGSDIKAKQSRPTNSRATAEDLYIVANGMLQIRNQYFRIQDYCVSRLNGTSIEVSVCEPSCTSPNRPCIKKCCEFGSTFDLETGGCKGTVRNFGWMPTFFDGNKSTSSSESAGDTAFSSDLMSPNFNFILGMPTNCDGNGVDIWPFEFGNDSRLQALQEYTRIRLYSDGSVGYLSRNRIWYTLNPSLDDSCLDSGELLPAGVTQAQILIKCSGAGAGSLTSATEFLVMILLALYAVATILMLISVVVYIALYWVKRNFHNWAIFIVITAMFVHYTLEAMTYYFVYDLNWAAGDLVGSQICIAIAVMSHFIHISIFSWMLVLNYDLWKTFNAIQECLRHIGPSNTTGTALMLGYIIFAVGVPSTTVGFGILMDNIYKNPETGVLVPEYGQYFTCTISRYAEGVYSYSIIGLLYIISLIFLIRTFYNVNSIKYNGEKSDRTRIIWKDYYSTDGEDDEEEDVDEEQGIQPVAFLRDKFWWYKVFFKVSVICGLGWIVQIISFIVFHFKANDPSVDLIGHTSPTLAYILFSDIVLAIVQPGGIFVVLVCRKRVAGDLKNKYEVFQRFGSFNKQKRMREPMGIGEYQHVNVNPHQMGLEGHCFSDSERSETPEDLGPFKANNEFDSGSGQKIHPISDDNIDSATGLGLLVQLSEAEGIAEEMIRTKEFYLDRETVL